MNNKKIRIAFWGSPPIATKLLEILHTSENIEVVWVITQADKPRSKRGQKFLPTPVKEYALVHELSLLTPMSLKKEKDIIIDKLKKKPVDFHVILAYGKIIPREIFELPPLGAVNFHASRLPLLRGAAPIEFALWQDFQETGWTMQKIDTRMDAGDIYFQSTVAIDFFDTRETLYQKLLKNLEETALTAVYDYAAQKLIARKQEESEATYCEKIHSHDARIDWNLSAHEINNRARAFGEKNLLFAFYTSAAKTEKKVKLRINVREETFFPCHTIWEKIDKEKTGSIVKIDQNIWVACGDNLAIPISYLQPEGKKEMDAKSFLNGARLKIGDKFY